jgi:hypothetical protein
MTSITAPLRGSILLTGEAGPRDPYRSFARARRYSAFVRVRGFTVARRLLRRLLVLKRFVGAGIGLKLGRRGRLPRSLLYAWPVGVDQPPEIARHRPAIW